MSRPGAGTLPPVLLVGGGRMGGAMLTTWVGLGLAPSVVVEPSPSASLRALLAGGPHRLVAGPEALPEGFAPASIVLAIKPQLAASTLPAYAPYAAAAVSLSIMAGRSLASLADGLGAGAPVVRAMPNTPASIGQGMTVACAAPGLAPERRALAEALLRAVGDVAWVEEESMLDAVTAVSGSGPAYVFLFAELLERAGVAQGLPPALARRLARRTVSGAGALLGASAEESASLREGVTSPAGTTAAALDVLMAEGALPDLLDRAVAAARRRSRELAG